MESTDLNSIDFTKFYTWEKVKMPTGNVYYKVPGTGYVYDPVLTSARTDGKKVLYFNPQPTLDERKKQQEIIDNQNSALGQYGPLVAGTAAAVGGKLTYDYLYPKSSQQQLADFKAQQELSAMQGANQPAPVVQQAPAQQAFVGAAQPQAVAPVYQGSSVYPVGTAANGGTLMSDGSVLAPNATVGSVSPTTGSNYDYSGLAAGAAQAAQGLGGAYQAYQGYNQYRDGDKVGGSLGMASGATNVAAAAGSSAAGSVAPYLGAAMFAYQLGKDVKNINNNDTLTDEEKAYKRHDAAQREYESYYTVGLAPLLRGGLERSKFSRGTMGKIDKLKSQIDLGARIQGYFGSSKGKEQVMRDVIRKGLQGLQVADDNFDVTLADGSKYNIGADGKNKILNLDGTERHPYDTDLSNPLAVETQFKLRPFVEELLGVDASEKQKGDLIGMLNNAVTSNATNADDVQRNIDAIASRAKAANQARIAEEAAKQSPSAQTFAQTANPYYTPPPPNTTQITPGDSDYVTRGFVPKPTGPIITKGPALMTGASNVEVNLAPPPGTQIQPPRSSTRSPGIALDGHVMTQDELMGKKVAANMNKRRGA